MKQFKMMNLWELLVPIFIYFIVTESSSFVLLLIPAIQNWSAVDRQCVSTLIALPTVWHFFYRKEVVGYWNEEAMRSCKRQMGNIFLSIIMMGCGSIALNNWLSLTNVKELSKHYQVVEQSFYNAEFGIQILTLGLLVPIVEEMMYRGIVYTKARKEWGSKAAIVISALFFGMFHMNMVQLIYAFLLGLLLGYLMEVSGNIIVPIVGHVVANLISLVRGVFGVGSINQLGERGFILLAFFTTIVTIGVLAWSKNRSTRRK